MSAWPEAIYTIKKITADVLAKHNVLLTSFTSVNEDLGTLSTNMGTNFNALNTKIDNKFNTLGNTIALKQYVVASTTTGLTSSGFVSGAVCFIDE